MSGGGSLVVRRQLGSKLRALRLKSGKKVADVVEAQIASRATVSRIEAGQTPVKMATVMALCWLYGADRDTTDELVALAPGTQQEDWTELYAQAVLPDWFGLYIGLEQTAASLRCFDPELVHGLLQTEDYARAVIGADPRLTTDVVEERVRFRMDRQRRIFARQPDLTILLGAGALSLVVGSSDVMAAQVAHIRELVDSGAAEIRVLPWSVGAYPMRGSFAILGFEGGEDPTVTFVEFSMGARYVEHPNQVREYEDVFADLLGKAISIEEWIP
ncbi:MAG TPA: helix-turn-helix transcriptional regulator [Pseudonocardia sp.]|jgi:transcriptional regulator with XRE-family HTH domain|nr:helix-turn-helix transcriptional regulator [Pseudonocardia sp.]